MGLPPSLVQPALAIEYAAWGRQDARPQGGQWYGVHAQIDAVTRVGKHQLGLSGCQVWAEDNGIDRPLQNVHELP